MTKDIKINLVDFDDGITNVGFRRISSIVKKSFFQTSVYIYNVSNISAHAFNIWKTTQTKIQLNKLFIEEISNADVIGFSGMSKFSDYIKTTISEIRLKNREALIVWGGVHATVFPEDAINYADAVCIGEGEKSFLNLLKVYKNGGEIDSCKGFWIRKNDEVIKNQLIPLMSNEELSKQPFQDYNYDINYVANNIIKLMDKNVYISQMGTKYTTLWSLGCPFKCIYCSNNKFLKNSYEYGKIRYSKPEYIIEEIVNVLRTHDYINYIEFQDDNILLIDLKDIRRFSYLYKNEVNLPLFIPGLHPSTFNQNKFELLLEAGVKKVRMGIQSVSQSTLNFYGRSTPIDKIKQVCDTLSSYYPQIIPPFYDIIIDNPMESEEDKSNTLRFLRSIKRPYLLYIYSLRAIPGTELWDFVKCNPQFNIPDIAYSYQGIFDKQMGFMVYLLAFYSPSDSQYGFFLKISKNVKLVAYLFPVLKILYMIKRFYYEIKMSNYQPLAMISSKLAWVLIKISGKRKFRR